MKKHKADSRWRNRIIGEATVPASELKANPRNWRTHSDQQRSAIGGILDRVGWVQRVIVNQRTGLIVDGHARVEQGAKRGESIPVVYVDLSPEEEALVLATLDPIGAMAGRNGEILAELCADIDALECAPLESLLVRSVDLGPAPDSIKQNADELEAIKASRRKGNQNTESKMDTEKYLVVVFPTRAEKEALLSDLGLPPDERYLPAANLFISAKSQIRSGIARSADAKHAGAGG